MPGASGSNWIWPRPGRVLQGERPPPGSYSGRKGTAALLGAYTLDGVFLGVGTLTAGDSPPCKDYSISLLCSPCGQAQLKRLRSVEVVLRYAKVPYDGTDGAWLEIPAPPVGNRCGGLGVVVRPNLMVSSPLPSELTIKVAELAGEFPVVQTATSTSLVAEVSINDARTSAGSS